MSEVKPGTKLRCVSAPEQPYIPIREGETYTVKRYAKNGEAAFGDGSMLNQKEPGVTLQEVDGAFRLSRFEVIDAV